VLLAGAPINGIDDWTVQFRAAIASPDDLPALSAMEQEALSKGRQLRDGFAPLKRKAVPWGTLSATCHVAYKARDRNPVCQCEVTVRAPVEDLMAAIWRVPRGQLAQCRLVRRHS
jgi:hypothetical protein